MAAGGDSAAQKAVALTGKKIRKRRKRNTDDTRVRAVSDEEPDRFVGRRPFSPKPRDLTPPRASALVSARPVAKASPSPRRSPSRVEDEGSASGRVRFASPMRDPTPPALRADELAASLLREADAEVRADAGAKELSVVAGATSANTVSGKVNPSYRDRKGKSKGKSKGKAKGKGKKKGTKKGKKAVVPPPGDF